MKYCQIWDIIDNLMGFLLRLQIVAFIIGLWTRVKGDGFLDTLSSGCLWIALIIKGVVVVIILIADGVL
ncbi:MAG: hypothetical protein FD181_541 [Prolixibacteraceae bacterium]|nr:MAG: hypothetical protein FD181_541 [Prolixibacteraceae bacterium]